MARASTTRRAASRTSSRRGEPQALELARTLIGYLPPNNVDLPPRATEWSAPAVDGAALDALDPRLAEAVVRHAHA